MTKDKRLSKPTVTVAVCAYNEEGNIGALIRDILKQEANDFIIEKILIVSDGSKDDTVKIASSFNSAKIEIKNYKKRMGVPVRLTEIYSNLESDFLVQFDADIMLSSSLVLRELVMTLIKNKKTMMCCGQAKPLPPKTLLGKTVNCTFEAYVPIKETWHGGHNIMSVHGCVSAFRKELLSKIHIPRDVSGTDLFTYLRCRALGYKYQYVRSAVVYFCLPQTLPDQINQNTRQHEARKNIKKYFPQKLIEQEFSIPFSLYAKSMMTQLLKHPFLSAYIFFINKHCYLKTYFSKKEFTGRWRVVDSTKRLS
jgi:glycosyltransferase involved in cell wall biosynthesis